MGSDRSPKCSVVIPAYDTADTLARAVVSVQEQTDHDFEIIIVEDCSRDDTLDVAQRLAANDPRINVMALAENGGQARALNQNVVAARGRWIATLEADDQY